MNRLAFCLFLFLAPLSRVSATHIVGGELTYKCLGNDLYEITLTVYRDCYTGVPWFDNPAAVGIFDSSYNLLQVLTLVWDPSSNDTLPIVLSNPCLTVPPDVCAHGTRYVAVVNLPFQPGGYNVVYQRCCRNQLIRNIKSPLATGITIISTISEKALLQCNNSIVFNQWPPVAICIHEPIDFDHSATDPDGDSLVYYLCTPLQGADSLAPLPQPPNPGPYEEVVWKDPPYNLDNVLSGDPLNIDPMTGFITGIPATIGNFVVGVCVDEYRDDSLISTTRRDFQYNVSQCGKPVSAFFVPELICDTLAVNFLNQGQNNYDYKWYFDWGGDDSSVSTAYSPTFTYPDTGFYTIALIAEPDDPCRDTSFQTIHVVSTELVADADVDFPLCASGDFIISAVDKSDDPATGIADRLWELTAPDNTVYLSDEVDPVFQLSEAGDYVLTLTVTSGNGCTKTRQFPISVQGQLLDSPLNDLTICAGDSIALTSDGGNPMYQYQWSPSTALTSTSIANPVAFPSVTTSYVLTVSYDECIEQDTVTVAIADPGTISATATPESILPGSTSQLEAMSTSGSVFIWEPASTLSDANIWNPVASPLVTTTYFVTVPVAGSCVLRDTVTVEVRSVNCDDIYVFFPTAFSPNGDNQNDQLKLESAIVTEVYWVIYNRWGEKVFEANALDDAWDGTFRGDPQPAETYGYYLKVRCIGGTEYEEKGNVTLLR